MADCPSCGAQLIPTDESDMPGLTSVDVRATRPEIKARPRSRLLSWISGDYADDVPSKAEALAVAPPDLAVQQEILRLQLEAELADLQAEAAAIAADALVELGMRETTDELALEATAETPDEATEAVVDAGGPATADPTAPVVEPEAAEVATEPSDAVAVDAPPAPGAESAAAEAEAEAERERMRRELEAQIAELQARVDAMTSDPAPPQPEDPGPA